jgi:hypothetical protein
LADEPLAAVPDEAELPQAASSGTAAAATAEADKNDRRLIGDGEFMARFLWVRGMKVSAPDHAPHRA